MLNYFEKKYIITIRIPSFLNMKYPEYFKKIFISNKITTNNKI